LENNLPEPAFGKVKEFARKPLRILTYSTLFPSAAQPNHGIFVENRLRHLLNTGCVAARVIAPVPWFPSKSPVFGRYAVFARTPAREFRRGLEITHPRYPVLPKLGISLAPGLLFAATVRHLQRLQEQSDFDIIDAHYFYPDGVAAALLGGALKKPFVVTARGSDINLISSHSIPRRMICFAARRAAGIIAVSRALKEALIDIGVSASDITVLRNGVDLQTFAPGDRHKARAELAVQGRVLLSVGHLIDLKGHAIVVAALSQISRCTLLIAGEGPDLVRLRTLASQLGLADRVRFLGAVPHEQLRKYYLAADALVLASRHEGWPNVLLEAIACGTPVIASAVGGIPEIISSPSAGVLMRSRTPEGVIEAVTRLFGDAPRREDTRAFAEQFTWDATSAGQIRLFEGIMNRHNPI
jgi:teichuronic acid biosynthesis glycosyltransferase TuaC